MPLSDLVRLTHYQNAAWWLEAVSGASMVVGILATCLWSHTLRRLKAGEPLSVPDHYGTVAFVLFGFMITVSIANGVSPAAKQLLGFLQHCSPLVMSYLIWSMWKENDVALM